MKGKITEIFDSVQGEGLFFGEKQLFVRFYGCNLGCTFCDTKLNRFMEYEAQELLDELKLYEDQYHSISFTGGEPLLQKDFLKESLQLTYQQGWLNYLETNGTLYRELEDVIDFVHFVAMDFKFPSSSGMKFLWDHHRRFLEIASAKEVFVKAVVSEYTHEDDLVQGLRMMHQVNKSAVMVLQPDSQQDQQRLEKKLEDFKEICRQENVTACVIGQMHKAMGVK